MANILFNGNPVSTNGDLPAVGSQAPDFKLVDADLNDVDHLTPVQTGVEVALVLLLNPLTQAERGAQPKPRPEGAREGSRASGPGTGMALARTH